MSDSLWPHGLQHARLPCPSLTHGVCSSSCPLSQWCHPTVSSAVTPFSSCLQSFPASGSFPMSRLFASGGQGVGASASVLPMNTQGWFPLGLTGLISLPSNRPTLTSIPEYWKNHSFDNMKICWKVMSLFFNMPSRFVIAFLPRSKRLLISWLQSLSTVILEPKKIKSATVSISPPPPSICHEVMGLDAMILVLWMLSFKPAFFTLLFHFHLESS